MSQPNTDPNALPAWEQGLITVLNADAMDSRQFVRPPWLTLVNAGYYVKEKGNQPWNDPMGTPDKNEFTIYRRTALEWGSLHDHEAYWIIKGSVNWYTKDGDASPHDHFQSEWKAHSSSVLNTPPSPLPLDPQSFHTAAESFYNLAMWLDESSKRLQNEITKIDSHASGFKGSSAQAFQVALLDLQGEMKLLREDIATTADWVQMLHDNGDAAKEFWDQIRQAWADFASHPEFEPNNMIAKTMADIEHAIDALGQHTDGWNYQSFADGSQVAWEELKNWWITVDFGSGPKQYDFRNPSYAIGTLDLDMHDFFQAKSATLHEKMAQQFQKLRDSFEHSYQNMSDLRTYVPLPPPKQDTNIGGGGGDGKGLNLDDLFNHAGGGGGDGGGGGINLDDLLNHGGGGGGGGGGANFDDLLNHGGGGGGGGGGANFDDLLNTGGGGGGGGAHFGNLATTAGGGGSGNLNLGAGGGPGSIGSDFTGPDFGAGPGGSSNGFTGSNGGIDGSNVDLGSFAPPPPVPGKPNNTKPGGVTGMPGGDDADPGPSPIDELPHGADSGISLPPLNGSAGGGGSFGGGGSAGGGSLGGGGSAGGGSFGGGSAFDPGKDGGVLAHLGGSSGPGGVPSFGGGGGADGFDGFGGGGADGFGGNTLAADGGGINAPQPPNGFRSGPLVSAPANTGMAGGDGLFGGDDADAANGGMPFMPPMGGLGGAGGQDKDKDRERTTWLAEEEEVWGTDPDLAPSVIGRDEEPDGSTGDRGPRSAPQAPGSPYGPARGTGRQTGRAY